MTEAEFVTSIELLRPRKGDVLVITLPRECSGDDMKELRDRFCDSFPCPAVFIHADVKVKVRRRKAPPSPIQPRPRDRQHQLRKHGR